MDAKQIATIGSLWGLCAVLSGIVANEKNRRFWVWFLFGVLTGPIALYLVLRSYKVVPPAEGKECPKCKLIVEKKARTCPRCKSELVVLTPDRTQDVARKAASAFFIVKRAAKRTRDASRKAAEDAMKEKDKPKRR